MVDAYFAHADAHGRHGLPITWIEPLLHAIKLVAALTPRAFRKAADFAQTVAAPNDWLHDDDYIGIEINVSIALWLEVT